MSATNVTNRRRTFRKDAVGWAFVAPCVIILGVFLLIPILMAAWVSVSDWTGRGSPLASGFVGLENYESFLGKGGLPTKDFGLSIRNNAYYFVFVVPLQTVLSLGLAVLVNRKMLRAKAFFKTAFYFPSVTSTVAITTLWTFLFSATGAINAMLEKLSVDGPNWFNDPRGIFHLMLGNPSAPPGLKQSEFLGVSLWDWLSGPSVAMCAFIVMAVFTTSGTFMLLFLAALQTIGEETKEAALVDGANGWQRFWHVTLPMLRPTLFTVITLGTIGTWQVFDQIYVSGHGSPAKTTLTPAFLSYQSAFVDQQWGRGAATSFVLFAIIIVFTILQRMVTGSSDLSKEKRQRKLLRPLRWLKEKQVAS
ncbi:MAG: sugar ABC transporter permease [Propionibacteriaceae bacterium]|jgi:multiple sugar transport system permease protein|nr:sugar ABC transporter permease [Propionibacteriaceae bacterium]